MAFPGRIGEVSRVATLPFILCRAEARESRVDLTSVHFTAIAVVGDPFIRRQS